jgi:non-ribosomal peptide synthetase component F
MNPALTGQIDMPGLDMELFEPINERSRHELSLNVISIKDELLLEFEYHTDLFDAATIERLAQRLIALFESATADPGQRFYSLPVLTDQERQHLLVDWNATETHYPKGQCLHQWIEAQVEKTPEATAVRFEDQSLSYAELNARANQLAHHLRTLEVGPDVLVGICIERSIEMVVGLLGIMKAGGAYVPLDPEYPQERLAYMLADAKAPVLLTQQRLVDGLPEHQAQVFCLDSDWGIVSEESATNPINQTTVDDLAYVIYTSGSTGKPKGVAVPHRGIVNRLQWMHAEYRLDETDRVLQKTPFSFDVSVWEFFWPLMTGARLVVAKPGGHKDSA